MKTPAKPEILLSATSLASERFSGRVVIVDCRFDFSDPDKGRRDYLGEHVPGAQYAHLDNDLSSPVSEHSGRHPLPDAADFSRFLARVGWSPGKLLVAYDERNSAMAARLWWLMRFFGQQAAILDGGLAAWLAAGMATETGEVEAEPEEAVELSADFSTVVSTAEVLANLENPAFSLVDARAPERFSGSFEPLDTRAGHIPGAINRPLGKNLDDSGCFKQPGTLRAEFEAMLQQSPAPVFVHSCGSGVTACHNQFAMELAGLSGSRVYPGSWSEWIRDESRPVQTGS